MTKIKLNGKKGKDKFALVNDEDFKWLSSYKWSCSAGYAQAKVNKRTTMMHRLIMNAPIGLEVDHINHNKLDNRKQNLRMVTRSQNHANQIKMINSSSYYKGTCWNKTVKQWMASIKINRKSYTLGYFKNELHAAMAYDLWAKELHGDFAQLNFKSI